MFSLDALRRGGVGPGLGLVVLDPGLVALNALFIVLLPTPPLAAVVAEAPLEVALSNTDPPVPAVLVESPKIELG